MLEYAKIFDVEAGGKKGQICRAMELGTRKIKNSCTIEDSLGTLLLLASLI